jgi:oxygen-independent coproporphyrinogen-3 oxidase
VIQAARVNAFESVSVDLIYGLPFQNLRTIDTTLDQVISLQPDRISLYNYAHMPAMFTPQKRY